MVRIWDQSSPAAVVLTQAAGLFLARFGVTTVDANDFFEGFESQCRQLLPSIDMYKMRQANSDFRVSFNESEDFLIAVAAASGVNILLEIGWLFDAENKKTRKIGGCFLRFDLLNNCLDSRLVLFLHEALEMKRSNGNMGLVEIEERKKKLDLLSQAF